MEKEGDNNNVLFSLFYTAIELGVAKRATNVTNTKSQPTYGTYLRIPTRGSNNLNW